MGKLLCKCGHLIIDQTDALPFKANYVRDQDVEDRYKQFEDVKSFLSAIKKGEKVFWIQNFYGKDYPTDIDDASIIHDLLLRDECKIFECSSCGRLLVQQWGANSYFSFYPEDEKSKGLFSKNIENNAN